MKITIPYALMFITMIVFDAALILGCVYLVDQRSWDPWWFLAVFILIAEGWDLLNKVKKDEK